MIFEWPGKIESVSFRWRNQNIYKCDELCPELEISVKNCDWVSNRNVCGILFSNLWFMEVLLGLIYCFPSFKWFCLGQTVSQQRYIRPWLYPITPIYLIYPISFIFGQKQTLVWRGFKHKYTKYCQIWFAIVNKNELNFLNLSSRI